MPAVPKVQWAGTYSGPCQGIPGTRTKGPIGPHVTLAQGPKVLLAKEALASIAGPIAAKIAAIPTPIAAKITQAIVVFIAATMAAILPAATSSSPNVAAIGIPFKNTAAQGSTRTQYEQGPKGPPIRPKGLILCALAHYPRAHVSASKYWHHRKDKH